MSANIVNNPAQAGAPEITGEMGVSLALRVFSMIADITRWRNFPKRSSERIKKKKIEISPVTYPYSYAYILDGLKKEG